MNTFNNEDYELFKDILAHSEFLSVWLLKNKKIIPSIREKIGINRNKATIFKDFFKKNILNLTEDLFLKYLRHNKMIEYTLIALEELKFKKNIDTITNHLSSLADVMLNIAYLYAYNNLIKKYGVPVDNSGKRIGFGIIALGKLGGFELNFSSDIDIIYAYDTEHGKIDTKNGKTSLTIHEFFSKLAEKIQFYLAEKTSDGFVFRVDLRLRPDGSKGPIALPLRSYELYYESYGQTWEKLMLLKARPSAGSIKTGLSFIKSIKPFILKKALDYNLIEDLTNIKAKIDRRVHLKNGKSINVKLGKGGIREIEFIVQLLQILNYPKFKDIYERNTLKSLDKINHYKLLEIEDTDRLIESYKKLRKIEHMIQIENELQTHTLPFDEIRLKKLAERCGYSNTITFFDDLDKIRENVHNIFNKILYTKDQNNKFFLDEELDESDYINFLSCYNIKDAGDCAQILLRIIQGDKKRPRSAGEKKILETLVGSILENLSKSISPKDALTYFERFFKNPYSIFMLFDITKEYPELLDKLINIFSLSDYISNLILTTYSIDYIYAPKHPIYEKNDIYDLFYNLTLNVKDEELEFEIIRKRHKELIFNVCYAFLTKDISVVDFMLSLSNLASGLLLVAFNKAYNSLRCFHGDPLNQINNTCNYLIIGLGKLGGYEMNLGSDLDLIFLYEGGGLTSGTKKITNQEFFSKVIQKTISYLSTTTTQGFLYKIDLRLRPSGASGTLITSLNSFKSYHEKGGMLWEKQILLKSRIINEGSSLSHEFNNIKEMLISTKPLQKKEILEIYNMRHRIETEKIKNFHVYDIKSGYGGLIDIEFIVQLLQMCSTSKSQQLKTTNTFKLINDLKHYNILKDRDYNILEKSYTFYRTIESLIRAYNNSYSSVLPKNKELLNKIASFYGYKKDGDKKIIDDYINIRKATRACFSRIFNEHLSQTD